MIFAFSYDTCNFISFGVAKVTPDYWPGEIGLDRSFFISASPISDSFDLTAIGFLEFRYCGVCRIFAAYCSKFVISLIDQNYCEVISVLVINEMDPIVAVLSCLEAEELGSYPKPKTMLFSVKIHYFVFVSSVNSTLHQKSLNLQHYVKNERKNT